MKILDVIVFLNIFFIYFSNSYHLVIDLNLKKNSNNSLCGDFDFLLKKEINPPCNSFYDIGERARNLEISYEKEYTSTLFIWIINRYNLSEIVVENNDESKIGIINNYCKVYFQVIDTEYTVMENTKVVFKPAVDNINFMVTNETIGYYKCNEIFIKMDNFVLENWHSSFINTVYQEFNSGFIRNLIFEKGFFLNSVLYSNSWLKDIPLARKFIEFDECIFTGYTDTILFVYIINIKINNCLFLNSNTQNFFIIYDNSKLILNNSTFNNNTFIQIAEFRNNNAEVIFNNTIISNNSFQFIIDIFLSNMFSTFNNLHVKILNTRVSNNIINDKFHPLGPVNFKENNAIIYLNCYRLGDDLKYINFEDDNTSIVISNSIFSYNFPEKNHITGLLYTDSKMEIKIDNSYIGSEFSNGLISPNAKKVIIKNSQIYSKNPIIGSNINVYLKNSSIENLKGNGDFIFNKTKPVSSIVEEDDGIKSFRKNEERKKIIIIPLVLFFSILLISFITVYLIYRKKEADKRKTKNENRTLSPDDEATGES
ncbi:hypothetical protein DICPUDRAFT_149610 [Dictyostelium purpureum]|uniref:Uncharacterized protein n=1 Tax=Dictyostelium purpureum TaxID=5786 RepID=F0ZE44_DICPU|nr:uncharacterized protein DICPUDRAFT_149610 [Dictyostelium purpureum]EGC37782.1 hypothetical protein DICPUDRAFT_149610 [Dictyostelium purpureum]|eukprot:XP_003285721.1 hypothetical protein DICPUDRAFT_149610 [Dictyostelium purpureum]